ncbi:MAG: hypothetical protein U1E45_12880 [Geminicoccaceae bacterium]
MKSSHALAAKGPNPAVAIPSIMRSQDKTWLLGFKTRLGNAGAPELIDAIDERLGQLGEAALFAQRGRPSAELDLGERVKESARIYEAYLAHTTKAKRTPAQRIDAQVKRLGAKEVVARAVIAHDMSPGLEVFARHGRLDCAFERIVLDFADEFEPEVREKAQANLARLQAG